MDIPSVLCRRFGVPNLQSYFSYSLAALLSEETEDLRVTSDLKSKRELRQMFDTVSYVRVGSDGDK